MILTITGREQAFAKNGAEYLKITGVDGAGKEVTKSVFDHFKNKWEALQPNTSWEFKMEKKGQFWNIVEIRPVSEAMTEAGKMPEEKPNLVKEATKIASMSKDDWAAKDEIKNRAVAISYAKDAWIAGKIEKDKLYNCADFFLKYMKGE